MSESKVILSTSLPHTRQSLAKDLLNAGLISGASVMVHSSLSSLGWVCGGSISVIQALMDVITPHGNLVMPTHSGDLSDPAEWENPTVPKKWLSLIRETLPAFDPRITPTRKMGCIAETFRTFENVKRSYHPNVSFASWVKETESIILNHSLENSLGENSPLGRLYDLNAWVLLLGVGYDSCTSFHLAEYRVGQEQRINKSAPILLEAKRVWKSYSDIKFHTDCYLEIGKAFEETGQVQISRVGHAETKLFNIRNAVDFAVTWLKINQAR